MTSIKPHYTSREALSFPEKRGGTSIKARAILSESLEIKYIRVCGTRKRVSYSNMQQLLKYCRSCIKTLLRCLLKWTTSMSGRGLTPSALLFPSPRPQPCLQREESVIIHFRFYLLQATAPARTMSIFHLFAANHTKGVDISSRDILQLLHVCEHLPVALSKAL